MVCAESRMLIVDLEETSHDDDARRAEAHTAFATGWTALTPGEQVSEAARRTVNASEQLRAFTL